MFYIDDFKLKRKFSTKKFKADTIAGYLDESTGYVKLNINHMGKRVVLYANRVIWEILNGEIPDGMQIDHINGVSHDNRIENLRIITPSENARNSRMKSNNTSGKTGVHVDKNGNYYFRAYAKGRDLVIKRMENREGAFSFSDKFYSESKLFSDIHGK